MMVKVNLSSHQNNTLEETKSKFYFAFVTKGKQNMTTWDKWCLETPQVVVGGGNKNVALGSSTHPTTPFLPSYCSCCCCPCRSSLSRQSFNSTEPTDLCETCWTPLSLSLSLSLLPPSSLSFSCGGGRGIEFRVNNVPENWKGQCETSGLFPVSLKCIREQCCRNFEQRALDIYIYRHLQFLFILVQWPIKQIPWCAWYWNFSTYIYHPLTFVCYSAHNN